MSRQTVRIASAFVTFPFLAKAGYGAFKLNQAKTQYKNDEKKSVTFHTSQDSEFADQNCRTSDVNQFVLTSGLQNIVKDYVPAWFYFSPLFGMIYGQWLQRNYPSEKRYYERVFLNCSVEGKMVIDVAERQTGAIVNDGREKVVILLHGVTGQTDDYYMLLMADHLVNNGFNVVALNHYGVNNEKDCRLMNFTKQKYIDEVVKYSANRFATQREGDDMDVDVFLFGYSLGGNHCLRYTGAACKNRQAKKVEDNDYSHLVKGVVSVSNPFDVLTTTLKLQGLQGTFFGLLDKYLAYKIYGAFRNYNFKDQDQRVSPEAFRNAKWSLLKIDDATRARAWGYKSGRDLHDHISCFNYLPYIDVPFLIVNSADEYIVKSEDVPRRELMSNPNCIYMETEYGGHCDFFGETGRKLYPEVVVKYLHDLVVFNHTKNKSLNTGVSI